MARTIAGWRLPQGERSRLLARFPNTRPVDSVPPVGKPATTR